jgi:hypothetical protein
MGYLLDQMEKIALAETQDNNNAQAARVVDGITGAFGLAGAGSMASMMPKQLEMLRHEALSPMRAAWSGLTHTRGSDARRFLAQEKAMNRNINKAIRTGDADRAVKLVKQLHSPTHRAWRGFKSMSLPGKFKLLAPVVGTAAGAVGLGVAGAHSIDKAFNG